ncbi:antirepressor [Pasteurella multocida]|nr:antirepressor [Pasteurella multocida]
MTNSNLIPVFNGTIQNTQIQLCNARELHAFVESKREYATWIKDRITDYGFIENEDYIIVTERTNGRPRKEYHITLDMGKELGMVERNEKGRQIRKHFIEIEKRAKQPQQLALPEPEKKYTFSFTEYELQQLAWAWFAFSRCTETLRKLYSPLQKLGSHFAPKAYGQGMEYYRLVQSTNDTINRITKDFKCVSNDNWRVLEHVRNFDKNAIVYNQIHD